MTKQTKTLIAVGAVAAVGYLIYKNNSKKSFVGDKRSSSRVAPPKGYYTTYVAGGYDTHEHAQWISLGGQGIYGYWYPCESQASNWRPCYPQGSQVGGTVFVNTK